MRFPFPSILTSIPLPPMSRTRSSRSETQNASHLRVLLHDAEKALSNTAGAAGEKFDELRERMRSAVDAGRAEAARRAKQADELVHEHPYYAVGIAAGIGALIGILISRSCSNSR
jgi:ElaB/YqjD/DUF883 family membrane-anchored ribosome-binding protein